MMKRERLLLLLSALLLALFTGIGCRSGQAEAPAPPETEEQVITVRPETTEEEKKPESAPEAETSETSETTVAGTSTQVIPTKEQAVKTGDEANLFLTILVLCTSAVGIGMGLIGRKRSHKQK